MHPVDGLAFSLIDLRLGHSREDCTKSAFSPEDPTANPPNAALLYICPFLIAH